MSPGSSFEFVRALVHRHAGIVVDEEKEYLVQARLLPLARQEGFESVDELVGEVRRHSFAEMHRRIVDAMATTETSFFRDAAVFEALLHSFLPKLVQARANDRTLSICSAACASGQEPYSIVMLLREHFPDIVARWDVRILALDLSRAMIEKARTGLYSVLEVGRGLPARMLIHHFQREGMQWQVRPHLRSPIEFRQFNFMSDPLKGPFDLVLMRNVLMYFDRATKARVIDMARQALRPDGALVVGSTETILSDERLRREIGDGVTIYRPHWKKEQDKWKSTKRTSSV